MGGEQGFDVPRSRTVSDVGKELELCLDTAGGEDDQRFASSFPGFEFGDNILEERGLEITVAEAGCP